MDNLNQLTWSSLCCLAWFVAIPRFTLVATWTSGSPRVEDKGKLGKEVLSG